MEELKQKIREVQGYKQVLKGITKKNCREKLDELQHIVDSGSDALGKRVIGYVKQYHNALHADKMEKAYSYKVKVDDSVKERLQALKDKVEKLKEKEKAKTAKSKEKKRSTQKVKKGGATSFTDALKTMMSGTSVGGSAKPDSFSLLKGGYLDESQFQELIL